MQQQNSAKAWNTKGHIMLAPSPQALHNLYVLFLFYNTFRLFAAIID
jgi:hypothetical protein